MLVSRLQNILDPSIFGVIILIEAKVMTRSCACVFIFILKD
jgi:hypothetical protein